MDPSQKPLDYAQPSPYSGYAGPAVVRGVSSSDLRMVGNTDPLNDPRIKYSETLCLARAVAWFPFADFVMWLFLLGMTRAWWIFGLFMILILSGVFAGKLMQRAWAYTYFGVLLFFVFLRGIFLIVVLAFAGRIGRFTGAIAVGILITIAFQVVQTIYVWKFIKVIPTLSDDEKTMLKPLATCCCDVDARNCCCP